MEKIEEYFKRFGIDEYYKNRYIEWVSVKFNVKPSYIILTVLCVMLILSLHPWAFNLLFTYYTLIKPLSLSYTAVENKKSMMVKVMCLYWIIYTCYVIFEATPFNFFPYLPFYYYLKMIILKQLYTQHVAMLYQFCKTVMRECKKTPTFQILAKIETRVERVWLNISKAKKE